MEFCIEGEKKKYEALCFTTSSSPLLREKGRYTFAFMFERPLGGADRHVYAVAVSERGEPLPLSLMHVFF